MEMEGSGNLILILENRYDFSCEGGPLKNCEEWNELKKRIEWLHKMALGSAICDNWGKKDSGTYGPCGECDYCKEYQND